MSRTSGRARRDFNKRVGLLIAELRGKAGLSQAELAERTGITEVRISRLESGLVRLLAEEVSLLAESLGVGGHRFVQEA